MISVIIPVYNTENYLYNCLNSVLNQTYGDFEVICINDCSTDSSPEILEYYSRKDERIKVIHNEINKGQGYSRNRGLEIAKGEYIFFLDSDDWLKPNSFELLYSQSKKLDLDLLIFKGIVFYEKDININFENMYSMNFLDKYDGTVFNHLDIPINELFNISIGPCFKLYKKSFLDKNNIRFPNENLIQEIIDERIDGITFTSPLTVVNLFKTAEDDQKDELVEKLSSSTLTVAIGPITGKILDDYNVKHIYPERYTVKDMIDLMFRELNNQN